jgi:predicted secreted protein
MAAAVALLGGIACGGAPDEPTFTRDDRVIQTQPGDRFRIALDSNPSIGDDWRVVGEPDRSIVRLVSEDFVSDQPDEDVVGAGGTQLFVFEALARGTTEIEIFNCYRCLADDRPTPENEPYAETVTFTLEVS